MTLLEFLDKQPNNRAKRVLLKQLKEGDDIKLWRWSGEDLDLFRGHIDVRFVPGYRLEKLRWLSGVGTLTIMWLQSRLDINHIFVPVVPKK